MKIVILDGETLGKDLELSVFEELGEVEIYGNTSKEEVSKRISDCDVCIINKIKLFEENLKNAQNLKLICLAATGYDNVDTSYCKSAGIAVCNVVGYSTHSVSQLTLAMALSLSTRIFEYRDYVNCGKYQVSGVANYLEPVYHQLLNKTWGIVGLGNIGRQVARVAKAIGCRVICHRRTPDKEFETVDLDTLLSEADVISVHVPLTDETRNLIGKKEIARMKKDAIFINVSRGAVVDEEELCNAVLQDIIGAVGVDVYSVEPFPANHPYSKILGRENVCLTPHIAWAAYEARVLCTEEIMRNIKAFFKGEIRNRVEL